MIVTVKVLQGGECSVEVDTDLVAVVKQQVAERLHVPAHQQRLLFKGKALADELSLCHYNIPPNAKLNLVVKAVGERTQHQATELVATVPATPTLWDLLSPLLSRHFSPTDAQVVLQQFQKDYERNLHGLSLDDVERLATQLLQPSQMQPLSCAMLE
uniref:Ubiquitin like 4A n=1 Tax=Eptatretus burgeri TaxID=7764 RepID=A0A8C4PX95_EPTBU